MGRRDSFVDEMPKRVLSKIYFMQHLDPVRIDHHQISVNMIKLLQQRQDTYCQKELNVQKHKADKINIFFILCEYKNQFSFLSIT